VQSVKFQYLREWRTNKSPHHNTPVDTYSTAKLHLKNCVNANKLVVFLDTIHACVQATSRGLIIRNISERNRFLRSPDW